MAAPPIGQGDVPLNVRQRICVWFSMRLGKNAVDIVRDLQTVFGMQGLKSSQVNHLIQQFRQGRTRMADLRRSGRPKSVRTDENINKVRAVIQHDRRSCLHKVCEETGLSYGSTQRIVKTDLKLKKKVAKLIPHVLTPVQRNKRVAVARQMLEGARNRGWIKRIITADESWFYVQNPHPKMGNMEWLEKGMDRPQVALRSRSCKKALLVTFFDWNGLLYRHWILRGTVKAETYVYILRQLRLAIRNRRRQMWLRRATQPYLLHDDNASPHSATDTVEFQQRTGIEKIPHAPYSPDMAPCDFFLFPLLKKSLRGKTFNTVLELTEEVDNVIGSIPASDWRKAFNDWIARCHKCVMFNGRYFEGMKKA